MNAVPTWLDGPWKGLRREPERLPQAMLIHGPAGIGKHLLAERLAEFLLCPNTGDRDAGVGGACGRCPSCHLVRAGTHPDIHVLMPDSDARASHDFFRRFGERYWALDDRKEGAKQDIPIDAVRELRQALALRPMHGSRGVAILLPAESMTLPAANSLLKLLEEPAPRFHLILLSERPGALPITVRSRCQPLRLRGLPFDEFRGHFPDVPRTELNWLYRQTQGAPLAAHALRTSGAFAESRQLRAELSALSGGQDNVASMAERWLKSDPSRLLVEIESHTHELIEQAASVNGGGRPQLRALIRFREQISQMRRLVPGPLNGQLLLEGLLISWQDATSGE